MVRLRSLDVISCAKVYGIIHMAIGILIALLLVMIALAGWAVAPGQQKLGMIGFLVIAAFSPLLYGAVGLVIGAVSALLYNLVASAVGGIQMELEAVPGLYSAGPTAQDSAGEGDRASALDG